MDKRGGGLRREWKGIGLKQQVRGWTLLVATALSVGDLPVRAGGQSDMRVNGAAIHDGPRTSRQGHLFPIPLGVPFFLNLLPLTIVHPTVDIH
jgi:hypothetical protein